MPAQEMDRAPGEEDSEVHRAASKAKARSLRPEASEVVAPAARRAAAQPEELELARLSAKVPDSIPVKEWEELQKWEKVDVPELALATVTAFAKRRPVTVGIWVFGLLVAAFAGGLPVNDAAAEGYSVMLQQAEVIDSRQLGRSLEELQKLEEDLYRRQGWFGSCDDECKKASDKVSMARVEVDRLRKHRDEVLSEARHEVGIWSSFGVQDVRNSFWEAWKAGKDFAARCTTYNIIFSATAEDNFYAWIFRIIFTYIINLTVGLVGAFFFFIYNVYCLIVSYGSAFLSGLAFLLLTVVAGISVVSAYLGLLYGAVAGGGMMLLQHAARQAAIDAGGVNGKQRARLQDVPRRAARCPV